LPGGLGLSAFDTSGGLVQYTLQFNFRRSTHDRLKSPFLV
jgi:hypothetical protein